MYLVDLQKETFEQVVDWNDQVIDWQGRGADRGLRGIAFYNGLTIAAASDEIFVYSQDFKIIKSFRNHYLKHCHEICIAGRHLYLASTGFDTVLVFDLEQERFVRAYCYRDNVQPSIVSKMVAKFTGGKKLYYAFDPEGSSGPEAADTHHINNVFVSDGNIYFSGTKMDALMRVTANETLEHAAVIPKGTHNVQFLNDQLVMNNTVADAILIADVKGLKVAQFNIPTYDPALLQNHGLPNDHARQAFGRGLCISGEFVVGGSSPATISVYRMGKPDPVRSVNLTMDIRNAIHGLEVYPFASRTPLPSLAHAEGQSE